MAYKAPIWEDGKSPAISAENLNALSQAAEGAQVLRGNSAPTSSTEGAVGQFYLVVVADSDGSYPLYQCVAIANGSYTWRDTRRIPNSITSMLGIPAPGTINGALNVLANIGNVHVWQRVQTYSEEVPAGYTLGPSKQIELIKGKNNSGSSISYRTITVSYSSSISVSENGDNITLNSPSTVNLRPDYPDEGVVLRGKFIQVTQWDSTYVDTVSGVLFIQSDASFADDYPNSLGWHSLTCSSAQVVTGTPAIPAGTHVDYLTSTDRNAYPDNVTDAQDAYYTLGDVVSGSFYMGIPANPYQNTYTYSSSLSVSDDGTVSLANPSTAISSQWSPLSTDAINSTLVGKFVQWTCQDPNNLDTKYPFNASPSPIIFIPSDAKITVTTPDGNERFTLSKYQPVTGYPAIPANNTITYLGQLGGGARIEVGSYVGTGTYGSSNPNTLTFGFEPKMVVIVPETQYAAYMLALVRGVSKVTSWWYGNNSDLAFVTWADNFVSWYSTGNERQLNLSGETYDYIAIG